MAKGWYRGLMQRLPGYQTNWPALRGQAAILQGPTPQSPKDMVYVVSDSHLGARAGDAEAFARLLAQKPAPRLLILMGDVFHLWLNPPRLWTPLVRQTMQRLETLRRAGSVLWLVVGNHEFFVPKRLNGVDWLPFEHIIHDVGVLRWGNKRYAFTHGDLANRQDKAYLRFRWLIRGFLARGLFGLFPAKHVLRYAEQLSHSLAADKRPKPIRFSRQELDAFAKVMGLGVDATLIGHFHREMIVASQGSSAPLYIAPDWLSTGKILRIGANGTIDSIAL